MEHTLFRDLVELVRGNIAFLPDKPEETPESTVRALAFAAVNRPVSAGKAMDLELPKLSEEQRARLTGLVDRRISGIPLAHLTGRQQFMGIELITNQNALVPRKETEFLCQSALELVKKDNKEKQVIDVCTGSGNLAVALGILEPSLHIYASDLSEGALELAKENIDFHGLANRIEIFQGDLFEPFMNESFYNKIDIITCNPPYVSSEKVEKMDEEISSYEPRMAFDGGSFGVKIIYRLIKEATEFLVPGGGLAFEVGLGQGEFMVKRLLKKGVYKGIRTKEDKEGNVRIISAVYSP